MHPDMKWSDGEPMGAEDVKYTLDRANEEEWFNYTSTTKNLTAEIPDPDTLVITTSVPDPRLPAVNFYVLPKHIYEKLDADAAANHPAEDRIGGGPFMIDEVKSGEFVRLARNPNWFGKKPVMDELIIRTFADAESEYQALAGRRGRRCRRCAGTAVHADQRRRRHPRCAGQPGWLGGAVA